jgi:hypothetical protein
VAITLCDSESGFRPSDFGFYTDGKEFAICMADYASHESNNQPDWLRRVFLPEFKRNWRILVSWIIAEPFTKVF